MSPGRLGSAWSRLRARFYRRLADAHRHFGNIYGIRQEHRSAVENYTRATILDPAYTQAYFSRGVLYWRELGNHQRAVQDLTRVLELDPSWAEAYFNRGIAYRMLNETQKAIADFERYLLEGKHDYWLDSAQRQLADLRSELAEVPPAEEGATGEPQ